MREKVLVCCEETLLSSDAYCDDGADDLSVMVSQVMTRVFTYAPIDGDVAFDEGDDETGRACWTNFSTFLDD